MGQCQSRQRRLEKLVSRFRKNPDEATAKNLLHRDYLFIMLRSENYISDLERMFEFIPNENDWAKKAGPNFGCCYDLQFPWGDMITLDLHNVLRIFLLKKTKNELLYYIVYFNMVNSKETPRIFAMLRDEFDMTFSSQNRQDF